MCALGNSKRRSPPGPPPWSFISRNETTVPRCILRANARATFRTGRSPNELFCSNYFNRYCFSTVPVCLTCHLSPFPACSVMHDANQVGASICIICTCHETVTRGAGYRPESNIAIWYRHQTISATVRTKARAWEILSVKNVICYIVWVHRCTPEMECVLRGRNGYNGRIRRRHEGLRFRGNEFAGS